MPTTRTFICIMITLVLACSASADVPRVVSYQGRLLNAGGQPADTTVEMTFSIYSDTARTKLIWDETHSEVVVADGIFSVLLGSVDAMPDGFFDGGLHGLTVAVGSDAELLPPVPMVSMVYALRSLVADSALAVNIADGSVSLDALARDGATDGYVLKYSVADSGWIPAEDLQGGTGTAGGWTDLGTVVRQQTLTDRVALGTTTPLGKLHVEAPDVNTPALHLEGSGRDIVWQSGEHFQVGEWDGTTFEEHFRITNTGNVGFGTGAPLAHLHIKGEDQAISSSAIRFDDIVVEDQDAVMGLYSNEAGSAGSAFSLAEVNSATGDLVDKWGFARLTSGADSDLRITYGTNPHPYDNFTFMTLASNGNVGIGITSPDDAKLQVSTNLDHAIIGNSNIFTGGDSCVGVLGLASVGFPGYPVGVVGRATTGTGVLGVGNDEGSGCGVIGRGMTGVKGQADEESYSVGVLGEAANSPYSIGVHGTAGATISNGAGVKGEAFYSTSIGVHGVAEGVNGRGVRGEATDNGSSGSGYGGWFSSAAGLGRGVRADCSGANGYGVYALATGTSGTGLYAQGGTSGKAATFRGNVQILARGSGAPVLELGEGLDYAEGFDVTGHDNITPGMVLAIDPQNPGQLTLANKAYDTKVAGIVAGANGLGSGVRLGGKSFDRDVALAGRVYCYADASNGAIEPGDLLTTSCKPGHAMKVDDYSRAQGAILGKAMQPLAQGETGMILVLVTLQ